TLTESDTLCLDGLPYTDTHYLHFQTAIFTPCLRRRQQGLSAFGTGSILGGLSPSADDTRSACHSK
ncbi:MAG TPA: hypothetical protein P5555_07505, partial [Candidatus Paceibacterota bacterium]|nr:hypothetical protein [Verrucomicrobiota bacterium]HRZ45022.1 hypothetical protein [Candidatus Paceibacterota bacterium]HSA02815.1 hypothetical protein [Candidatus Paceibacterota bacterium]